MTPEETGKKLEESEEIAALHASTSTNADNQTLAPDAEKPLDDHFICLVHREGEIFEVNQTYLKIICTKKGLFLGIFSSFIPHLIKITRRVQK